MRAEKLEEEAAILLRAGELIGLESLLSEVKVLTKRLVILKNMLQIFEEEVRNDVSHTIFDYSSDLDVLVRHYVATKLLLRRIDFDLPEVYQEELYDYCVETGVSGVFLAHLIIHNMFYPQKVYDKVRDIFIKREGA